MIYPSLESAKKLATGYRVVPVALELMADLKTSIQILYNLKHENKHCFLLESVAGVDHWSRYSFLGYSPKLTIQGVDGMITVTEQGETKRITETPITALRKLLAEYKSPAVPELCPFTGGLVGCFSYDFVKYADAPPELHQENPEQFDDFHFMLMDKVIAFDHFKQKIYLIANIATDDIEQNYAEAMHTLQDMQNLVLAHTPPCDQTFTCGVFTPTMSEEEFCNGVKTLQKHIMEGDIFQAVLSNRFTASMEGSLLEAYRILRMTNPSPYMVYMHMDDLEISCASPETMVTLRNGQLSTFPLAGTRPQSDDAGENIRREKALLQDEKELSEHDMLVDLARNDLGKISAFGSVEVTQYRSVKHYSHVMHISSMVSSKIAPEKDALDAVMATLPAGTLSGAPKKKACELLALLEGNKRGPYGGAMGYMDFTGNADFCIGIRMAVRKGKKVYVQAGAGIVADSVPENEYAETLHKARAVMDALCKGGTQK